MTRAARRDKIQKKAASRGGKERILADILFLGTCAADFSPRLLTDCRDRFDDDARRASCALVNGRYLIDCGPHCPDSLRIAGIDPGCITDIFLTHLHADHFVKESVEYVASSHPVRLWVRSDASLPQIGNVEVMRMDSFERYGAGEDFFVTGLPANHDPDAYPQHLLIEAGGKKIFYGMDGGWLLNKTYAHLWNTHLDLCVLDGTCGDYEGDYRMGEHNSIPMIRLMLPSLRTVGAIDDRTLIFISHLAPSLHKPHAETVRICEKDGIHVASDGLRLSL